MVLNRNQKKRGVPEEAVMANAPQGSSVIMKDVHWMDLVINVPGALEKPCRGNGEGGSQIAVN